MWRGQSSVVGVVLLIAVVLVAGAVVGVSVFNLTGDLPEPAPNVAESSGELIEQDGTDGGHILITHQSGDPVIISSIRISVTAECGGGTKEGDIVNMPAGSGNNIDDDQIEGDNIFDQRSLNAIDNDVDNVDEGGALLDQREYTVGDTILFRIPSSDCDLTVGDSVRVQIIHEPSNSLIFTEEMVVS